LLLINKSSSFIPSSTKVFIASALTSNTSISRALESQLFRFATPDFKPPKTVCCSPGLLPEKVGPISNNERSG